MMSSPRGRIRPEGKWSRDSRSWALVLMAVSLLGIGCGVREAHRGSGRDYAVNFRLAAEDTSRRLRNAHYFKLMGQPEFALKELEEAHRQNPANLAVANVLGQYYDELGLGERAQEMYQKALALDPDNPALLNNLGFSHYLAGHDRQAEKCFRQTLTRHPHNAVARNNLGLLLCRRGEQEEARRLWQEADGEAAAAQKLGQALAALGMADATLYAQPARPLPMAPATRPLPPRSAMAAAPWSPAPAGATLERPKPARPQSVAARQPAPHAAADATAPQKPGAHPPAHLTARERLETHIAILNGNGTPNLAHHTRSRLYQEGFNAVAIANFRDFGVDHTVIYYRPDSKPVATFLNSRFFPGAAMEPTPQLANSIDVKVILGHDRAPHQHAEAPERDAPKRL